MSANERYLMISFTKEEDDLFKWVMAHDTRVSRSQIGRELLEIGRLFNGSLTEAQLAKCALAYLKERYPMQWQDILDGKEFVE